MTQGGAAVGIKPKQVNNTVQQDIQHPALDRGISAGEDTTTTAGINGRGPGIGSTIGTGHGTSQVGGAAAGALHVNVNGSGSQNILAQSQPQSYTAHNGRGSSTSTSNYGDKLTASSSYMSSAASSAGPMGINMNAIAGPSSIPPAAAADTSMGEDEALRDDEMEDDQVPGSQRRKNSVGDDNQQRVQLACFYCRNKRIRCSGEKPICSACIKANVPCEWPSGRRKKRTRKEMEEAKRLEAAAAAAAEQTSQAAVQGAGAGAGAGSTGSGQAANNQQPRSFQIPQHRLSQGQSSISAGNSGSGAVGSANQGNVGLAGQTLSQFTGMDQFSAQGFENLFDSDPNNSYSSDAVTRAFDPSDFWNFPTTGGSSGSGHSANPAGPSTADNNNNNKSSSSGSAPLPQQAAPITTNYVWPTGFTPESTLPNFLPALSDASGPTEPTMAHFMSNHSPATDMRLINALENQAAFIEGNPDEDKDLELFYYRFAGSTAIQPGIHRISLKLQRRRNAGESPMTAAPQPEPDEQRQQPAGIPPIVRNPSELFDGGNMPLIGVWQVLFEAFLTNMSQHFPSVSRQRMTERFETGTMSNFLANCICACGARFAADAKDRQTQACAPFIAKAQELIVPLVHLPTTETTTGLTFLAWANFGQNSESGLWQYTGMAIRMAIDIGIHENSDLYESPAHVVRTRLLFWTLFITDRIVAFATGRPASITEDIVEIPLPEDQDFFPDPSRNTPGYPVEAVEPVPFVYFVRLMIICGRISNVLNGRRGRARTLVATAEPLAEQLAELQMRLVQFVAGLPESLRWSADNFRHQHTRGHGGCFLALHLWSHAVLALIYHPELLKSPSGVETPLNRSMSRNIKLSLASSRQICECMVFADLVAPSSYTSTPFLVQPLFVASMAIIHEMRAIQLAESTGNPSDMFLISMARQNLTALLNAISRMEQYWAGASYVATILEKRSGFKVNSHSRGKTLISLPDTGLLKRFSTDKDDPRDLAPATETSLRESIAKSERNNPSPYWLADLMAGYTVENMSFAPADSLDLERLLGGSGMGGFSTGFTPTPGAMGSMGGVQGQGPG